jgi:D-serine deaminase-like pyridoxal phosphate-dependent protein
VTFALPRELDGPAVVVDVDVLERNIRSWAHRLRDRGVGIRPHTKTTKCAEIIARQVQAGVTGLTVATIGEAESLADHGFDDLFIAYPVWAGSRERADRIRALHERASLIVGVESVEAAEALGRAVLGSERPLSVSIEVDCGFRRTGVTLDEVIPLSRACRRAGLEVLGAFTYGGQGYHACDAAPQAGDDEVRTLTAVGTLLLSEGVEPTMLSAGSTPTALHSARPPVTDERPGTYVFGDRQQMAMGTATLDDVSLVVATTVVASHRDGRFVLDAGSKVISTDRPSWLEGFGHLPAHPEARVERLSEHHAVCLTDGPRPAIGDVVALVPNHCCVVVNLADELVAVQEGRIVDRWSVLSRGANR